MMTRQYVVYSWTHRCNNGVVTPVEQAREQQAMQVCMHRAPHHAHIRRSVYPTLESAWASVQYRHETHRYQLWHA